MSVTSTKCAACQRLDELFDECGITEANIQKVDSKTCCDTFEDRTSNLYDELLQMDIRGGREQRLTIKMKTSSDTPGFNYILRLRFKKYLPNLEEYAEGFTSNVVLPYINFAVFKKYYVENLTDDMLEKAISLAKLTKFTEFEGKLYQTKSERIARSVQESRSDCRSRNEYIDT